MQKVLLFLTCFTLSLSSPASQPLAAETRPEPIPKIQDIDNSYANEEAEDAAANPSDYSHAQSRSNVIKSKLPGRLALDGSDSVIVNTEGYDVETHIDMQGRHRLLSPGESNNGSFNNHGLHTAGIIAGNGNRNPRFEGVAPGSLLYSVINDKFPMGIHESPPARISSSSWNTSDPLHWADWYLSKGQYNKHSQEVDQLSVDNKLTLFIFSAGNSGGTQEGYPDTYLMLNPSYGSAKNTLVVGRTSLRPTQFATFGSWGPSRDGRIKPDLVATTRIVSTTENHTYQRKGGSSQSTPIVAGVAALLSQYFRDLHELEPESALLKALLLNTADYVGHPGPSFSAGYGAVNARRAAQVITAASYFEGFVGEGETRDFTIDVPAQVDGKSISQMKIMLYWHDPAGEAYAESALVNNLDLSVNDGVNEHLPWILDATPSRVAEPATRGVDNLNNVEQVAIDNPTSGLFTVQVAGSEVIGEQPFWLVYSYVLEELELTFPIGNEQFFANETRTVFWDTHLLNEHRGLDTMDLSLDGGLSWEPMLGGDLSRLIVGARWTVPDIPMTQAKVRISKDGLESESAFFTISQPIKLTLTEPNESWVKMSWNSVEGADRYEVLHLLDGVWEVVDTTDQLSLNYDRALFDGREVWLSVRAVNTTKVITSRRADAKLYVPINHPPRVMNEIIVDSGYSTMNLEVLKNDRDSDGDPIIVAATTEPLQGSVSIMDNFSIRYSRPATFSGSDYFHYTVSDNRGGVTQGLVLISEEGYDTDADGVPDSIDVFPLDATASVDPGAVAVYPDSVSGAANDIVTVPFLVRNFEAISGVQGTLTWDPTVMELVTQANPDTGADEVVVTDSAGYRETLTAGGQTYEYEEPYFKSTNFTFVNDDISGERIDGILTFLWSELHIPDMGRHVDDEDTPFALQFRLIGLAGEIGQVELVNDPTPYLVAPASGDDIAEATQAGKVSILNPIGVRGTVLMGGDSDLPVTNVAVALEQNGSVSHETTDETGAFGYTLTDTSEIILVAEKTDRSSASRSVDVSDIVAIRKHILLIERLSTAPAMIAADATRDDSIDVADIMALQKVILAKSDSFSTDDQGNAQPVWRILEAAVANKATTENVFNGILDGADEIVYNDLSNDISDAHFMAIKLGDANQDWSPDSREAQGALGARERSRVSDIIRLSEPQTQADGSITIHVHTQATQGMVGVQYGLAWDGQVLQLEGMTQTQLPGFSQQSQSHVMPGKAIIAWTDALLSGTDIDDEAPVMTLHFSQRPEADRGTNIELVQAVLVGSEGSERAVMGSGSYYHPKGGTRLSRQGLIRSMHRSEGHLSLEFETQAGVRYSLESTQDLASGKWEEINVIEGSGRYEVIEIPTEERGEYYLRVRETE